MFYRTPEIIALIKQINAIALEQIQDEQIVTCVYAYKGRKNNPAIIAIFDSKDTASKFLKKKKATPVYKGIRNNLFSYKDIIFEIGSVAYNNIHEYYFN
jgi:hypothetical protein